MPDIQLGAHTVRSHGTKVLRFHMHDWIILVLLGVTDIILNVIDPFHRFVGKGMLTDLQYPFKGNTIPFWAVPLIGILLPFVIFTGIYFKRRNVYDLHHAILAIGDFSTYFTPFHHYNRVKKKFMVALRDFGLLFSVLITAVLTDAIKDAVGRPRPDFFWRCFPDGIGVFDKVTSNVICNGKKSDIKEGHKSFPSGHSSWSFAGLGFLSWYLAGKIRAFDRQGHVAKLCLVFLPLLCASLVAVSRVDDYWHHWQDVFAGGLLGLVVSSFCYLQFYPPPYDADGWGPHAYFHSLEDTNTVNQLALNSRPVEIEAVSVPSQNEFGMRYSSPTLDEMESGRRY